MKELNRRLITFLILFFVGVGFAGWSMIMPPQGIIDKSILIFIAQVFVLAASVYGFEIHLDVKEGKFDAGKVDKKDNSG